MPRGAGTQNQPPIAGDQTGVPVGAPAAPITSPTVVAEALCDLLTAPGAGVTRIRLVNARPRLLCAVASAARRRATDVETAYAPLRGLGTAVLGPRDPLRPPSLPASRSRPLGRL